MEKWSKDLAKIWKNYFPPCRPSAYEIGLLNDLYESKKRHSKERLKVLILGSTSEYRVWSNSSDSLTTIIDNSIEYHLEISNEIQTPISNEVLDNTDWLEMNYKNEFDFIVGDLIIGNLPNDKIIEFLKKIHKALKNEGIFFTKSFFFDSNFEIQNPKFLFSQYESNFIDKNAFQFNIYNLAMYCTNQTTFMMRFKDMYSEVKRNFDDGIISETTFEIFKNLGWNSEMKNEFYMMPKELWEEFLFKVFGEFYYNKSNEYWGINFPIYIITKNINK